jgi:hypothetical protein
MNYSYLFTLGFSTQCRKAILSINNPWGIGVMLGREEDSGTIWIEAS